MKIETVADDVKILGDKFTLMDLPYDRKDLEPLMGRETLDTHYGKHHQAYVDKLNDLIKGTEYESMSLKEIIVASRDNDDSIFNNAAQNWNHIIFWQSMTDDYQEPTQVLKDKIEDAFESIDKFKSEFVDAGMKRFGSGWVFLVMEKGKLVWKTYSNADNPVGEDINVLLSCDVWEHTYYLDYKNDRKKFLETFINDMINYKFVELRLLES
jgi:Fe-Mn family superoxide dismutase|tara:strand:- start:2491 stop:3123 length:633 start_codon:yes stop_codon:yes gene_type:complete